jgi:hypothetical protein
LPACANGQTAGDGGCLNRGTDPTQADWKDSVFACGQRSAWGLGGSVPFSAFSAQLGNIASGEVDSGQLVSIILASLWNFQSDVFFHVPYTLRPLVPADQIDDSCTGAPFTDATPIPNTASLTSNIPLQLNTPADLEVQISVPPLPSVTLYDWTACQTTALVLPGAIEPGSGLLPLGITSSTIVDAENNPSSNCETLDQNGHATGNVLMNVAPENGAVERDSYGVLALALDPASITGAGSGVTAMAGLIQTLPALPFGQNVTFNHGFPAYLQGATYNPNDRTFSNDTSHGAGASWEQLRFQDDLGRTWVTYFGPATPSFVLPSPPNSCQACTDRTLTSSGSLASPVAQQVVANVSLSGFLDFTNGPVAASLMEVVTGFSTVSIGCPTGVTGGGC